MSFSLQGETQELEDAAAGNRRKRTWRGIIPSVGCRQAPRQILYLKIRMYLKTMEKHLPFSKTVLKNTNVASFDLCSQPSGRLIAMFDNYITGCLLKSDWGSFTCSAWPVASAVYEQSALPRCGPVEGSATATRTSYRWRYRWQIGRRFCPLSVTIGAPTPSTLA